MFWRHRITSYNVCYTKLLRQTGNYSVKLPEAKMYGVEILAKGYLLYLDMVRNNFV